VKGGAVEIQTETIQLSTKGHTDIHDVTATVQERLAATGFEQGHVVLFMPGSTAGLTTIEYEPGLLKDIPECLERIAPEDADYHHHQTWGDHNGSAHVRSALVGPSLVVPFAGGKLLLGTWQQIVLIDFDERPRRRQLICQFTGA